MAPAAGFIGALQETRSAVDEIPEVTLDLRRGSGGDDASPPGKVGIRTPRWKSAVMLAAETREELGYAAFEKWVKALRRDAVDRTGERTVRTAWNEPDTLLPRRALEGEAAGASRVAPAPPAGSRVLVVRDAGRRRILLPPLG